MSYYQVTYTYLNFQKQEIDINQYVKADNIKEAEEKAKKHFKGLVKIVKITPMSDFFNRSYWFTFDIDGVWLLTSKYPFSSKDEAVDEIKCANLDDRKRAIHRIREGVYEYKGNYTAIIRGDLLHQENYYDILVEWLEAESTYEIEGQDEDV